MLPRKLHLEQINRFHDKVESLRKEIDEEKDEKKKGKLTTEYFKFVDKMWPKIDDFCEYEIQNKLDIMEKK